MSELWLFFSAFALAFKPFYSIASPKAVLKIDSRGIATLVGKKLVRRQANAITVPENHITQSFDDSDGAENDSQAEQAASLELSEQPSEGKCKVHGIFKDAHGETKFRVDESSIELAITGLPSVVQSVSKDTKTSTVSIGNVSAHADGLLSQQYIRHANALAASTFAAESARALSRLLHLHGYDGSSANCTYPFHMLMVNLHAASQEGYGVASSLVATSGKADVKWDPYGYASECPANNIRSWKCRKEWGWRRRYGSNGGWVTSDAKYNAKTGDRRRRRSRRRRRRGSVDSADPLGDSGGDVKCTDSGFSNALVPGHCVGLCGAKCDCWESICGDNYRCNYNPVCCAHDLACDRHGYLSSKCMAVTNVYNACRNDGLQGFDGR